VPQQLQLTVEKLVYGGHGLSRVNGRVVLTPLVLPGEEITAEPVDKLHARLVRIRQPAPERIPAPCPFFGDCGGCHYQHMPYESQVAQKVAILREVIRRVGKFDAPAEIRVITAEPWQYRNRTQLQVRDGRIGYLKLGSHELCPVDHCPISSPRLNEAIAALAAMVRESRWPAFVRRVELFTNESEVQFNVLESGQPAARHFFDWVGERLPGYAPGAIEYPVGADRFRINPRSFFQVNRYLVHALSEAALEGAAGTSALDLYAGAGLFSVPLARRFGGVTAVESGASAVSDLKFNAARAGVSVRPVRSPVDEYLMSLQRAPEFVLADPPRDGLGKTVVRELIRLAPARLHIVACDPATLARDLRQLLDAGYRLERLALADLFPQTYHLETIACCVNE
jgi:23S rRNA (uracil1939-C5)-methyltransferase